MVSGWKWVSDAVSLTRGVGRDTGCQGSRSEDAEVREEGDLKSAEKTREVRLKQNSSR